MTVHRQRERSLQHRTSICERLAYCGVGRLCNCGLRSLAGICNQVEGCYVVRCCQLKRAAQ